MEPKTPPLEMEKVPPVSFDGQIGRPSLLAEFGDLLLDLGDGHLVGVAQDGHDQAAGEPDSDADVDEAVIDDVVAVNRGVQDGELLQGGAGL